MPLTTNQIKALLRPLADKFLNDVVAVLAAPSAVMPPVPDPVPPPAPLPLYLSGWSIAGDTDETGHDTGEAKTWFPVPMDKPFFVKNPDGSLTFTARVEGATTSGSHYPRSELREMNGTGKAAWKPSGKARLTATLCVNEVPKDAAGKPGRIIIGQIHGPKDELCRLYYDTGKLYFVNDKAGAAMKETSFELKSINGYSLAIPLGLPFRYEIVLMDKMIAVSAIYDGITYAHVEPIGDFWTDSQLCYFKAGAYLGVGKPGSGAGTTGTGRGQVTFYALNATH